VSGKARWSCAQHLFDVAGGLSYETHFSAAISLEAISLEIEDTAIQHTPTMPALTGMAALTGMVG
jgi:hypothetical protein